MEGFTAEQATRFTGCTAHQLRYWDRIGLAKPSVQATGGRPGVRRLYSFRDIVALKVIRSMLDGGISLQRVRRAFDYLRKKAGLDRHLSEVKLVFEGDNIFEVADDENALIDALRQGQLAFFIEIGEVAGAADSKAPGYLYDRREFVRALQQVRDRVAAEGTEPTRLRAER